MNTLEAIAKRKTIKVLGDQPWKLPENTSLLREQVRKILEAANDAPFHFQPHASHFSGEGEKAIVPWRFHILYAEECRKLATYIEQKEIKAGKILQMLYTADVLIQATWLPDPAASEEADQLFEPNMRNMEHIAAASAAIQNALLAATSMNIPSYWSSGGVLREEAFCDLMKINSGEVLLGSLFLFPEEAEVLLGPNEKAAFSGLRGLKGPIEGWAFEVNI